MQIRTLKEISRTDTLALTAKIDYWKDNDAATVLFAYAELKRRNYSIDTKLTKRLTDFCSTNGGSDAETLLSEALKSIGYNNYNECYENEIVAEKKTEQAIAASNNSILTINPTNIISAGRNIKSVVYVVLGMIVFAIIAVLTVNSSRNLDTIKNTYLFLGVASLFCNIIILFQLHSAGDNLEKSVIEKQ